MNAGVLDGVAEGAAPEPISDTASPECIRWPFPLVAARVRLRPLKTADLGAFLAYRADPDVGRYQGWSPMSEVDGRNFIESMLDVQGPALGAWVQLAIALRDNDRLIGDVGVHVSPDGQTAQIGYSCATAFQRKGLATEAVQALVSAIVEHTMCSQIRATVDRRNIPSERLLLRLGFDAIEATRTVFRGEECVEVSYARNTERPRGSP